MRAGGSKTRFPASAAAAPSALSTAATAAPLETALPTRAQVALGSFFLGALEGFQWTWGRFQAGRCPALRPGPLRNGCSTRAVGGHRLCPFLQALAPVALAMQTGE